VKLGYCRWLVVLAMVAFSAFLAAGVWLRWHKPEPVYGGHPLSYWLAGGDGKVARNPHLPFPVYPEGLDSNALPHLIGALKRKSSWPESSYSWFYLKCPPSLTARLPNPFYASVVRERATDFLAKLGPAARPAVPALIDTLRNDKEFVIRGQAAYALGAIGDDEPSVIDALRAAGSDTNGYEAFNATTALNLLHH
jgi:hypothetical protein